MKFLHWNHSHTNVEGRGAVQVLMTLPIDCAEVGSSMESVRTDPGSVQKIWHPVTHQWTVGPTGPSLPRAVHLGKTTANVAIIKK